MEISLGDAAEALAILHDIRERYGTGCTERLEEADLWRRRRMGGMSRTGSWPYPMLITVVDTPHGDMRSMAVPDQESITVPK